MSKLTYAPLITVLAVALLAGGCSLTGGSTATTTPDEAATPPASEMDNNDAAVATSNETDQEPFVAQDGRYSLNADKSSVEWNGRFSVGDKGHNGTVDVQSGWMTIENGQLMNGEAVIDMNTITAYDYNVPIGGSELVSRLITHLKSEDFFSVDAYPTTTFSITNVAPVDGSDTEYTITGDLTIKGQTNEITVPATFATTNAGYALTAAFDIDRSRWDVRYGSENFFDNLGDKAIDNEIRYMVSFVADEKAPVMEAEVDSDTTMQDAQ